MVIEKACIDTVVSGMMTKDLALLVGNNTKWLNTKEFIEKVKENTNIIQNPLVNEEDVAHIVASWTGVPVQKLTETESVKLLNMELNFANRTFWPTNIARVDFVSRRFERFEYRSCSAAGTQHVARF